MKRLISHARALRDATEGDKELHRASRGMLAAVQRLFLLGRYRKAGEPEGKLNRSEDIDPNESKIGGN